LRLAGRWQMRDAQVATCAALSCANIFLLHTIYLIKIQLFHHPPQNLPSGPPTIVTAFWQNLTRASDGAFLAIQTHCNPSRCPAHLSYAVSYACSRPVQANSMHSATGLDHCVILSS